jgi:hypothetical protein
MMVITRPLMALVIFSYLSPLARNRQQVKMIRVAKKKRKLHPRSNRRIKPARVK